MKRKIILVEPEIPENTGFIARLSANFDYDIRIVNPDFNLAKARKTASSAQDKLREARIFDSVEEAVNDLDYVVGTKPGRGVSAKEFQPSEETSLMIGRESSGLTDEELELCETVLHIDTGKYPSINQSHASAILMHCFHSPNQKKSVREGQERALKDRLPGKVFSAVIDSNPSPDQVDSMLGELNKD